MLKRINKKISVSILLIAVLIISAFYVTLFYHPNSTPETSPSPSSTNQLDSSPTYSPKTSPTISVTTSPTPTPTVKPNVTIAESLNANGLCYGPFRDGQSPDAGIFPTTDQIKEDLETLRDMTGTIRTYSSTNSSESIPAIAKQLGFKVFQGVFLSNNTEQNEAEVKNAIDLANQNLVNSIIVGNEILLTNTLSESTLIQYIKEVKQNVPASVTVTTAEPWRQWLDHPNLTKEADYLMVHIHPFWEKQTIETAAQYVIDRYNDVTKQYPDKQVVIGETGWPTAGNTTWAGVPNQTIPNETNQKRFLKEFTQLAANNNITYFYFDAFDEEYKWNERSLSGTTEQTTPPLNRTFSGNMPGSSWGIFKSNGELKPHLTTEFNGVPNVATRETRTIFANGTLSAGYGLGVNTSNNQTNWLSNRTTDGSLRMDYPTGQSWGSVFVTVGDPSNQPRPWKDFSQFHTISITVKGEVGNESVQIGIKDANNPDDGTETKLNVPNITTSWQTYTYNIALFKTADLSTLYVPIEFVFSGSSSQTVYFKNIEYLK